MPRASVPIAVALAGFALCAAGPVHGEDPATQAKGLFKKGQVQYNLGEYRGALDAFRDAYRVKDDPVFLYNIAQCHRQLGENVEALRFYRTYLRAAKSPANKAEVERKIQELERAGGSAPPPAVPAPGPAPSGPAAPPPLPAPSAAEPPPASPATVEPSPAPAAAAPPPAPAAPAPSPSPPPVWLAPAGVPVAPPPPPAWTGPAAAPAGSAAPPAAVASHKRDGVEPAPKQDGSGHTALWIALGVLVAGAAAAAFVLTRNRNEFRGAPDAPTDLGTGHVGGK